MKIKPLIIVFLLLNCLMSLKAGILQDDRPIRMLHPGERGYGEEYFEPTDKFKILCYAESRLAKQQGVGISLESDAFLQDFLGDVNTPGTYDAYKDMELQALLEVFDNDGTSENHKYVIVWFMRQRLDDGCDLEDGVYGDDMRRNVLTFYRCYPMVVKTITKAKTCAGATWAEKFVALQEEIEALPAGDPHKRDYLDYPACFAELLQ